MTASRYFRFTGTSNDTSNHHHRDHSRQFRDPIVDSALDDTYYNTHCDDAVDLDPGDCGLSALTGVYLKDSVCFPQNLCNVACSFMQIVSRNTNVIHLASVSDNLETTWSIGNDEFLLWRHDRQNRLLWMLVRGIRNELHGITGFSPNPPTNRDGSFGDEVCRQHRRGSSRSFTSFSSLVPLWKIPTLLLAVGLRRLCEAEPSGCDRS